MSTIGYAVDMLLYWIGSVAMGVIVWAATVVGAGNALMALGLWPDGDYWMLLVGFPLLFLAIYPAVGVYLWMWTHMQRIALKRNGFDKNEASNPGRWTS